MTLSLLSIRPQIFFVGWSRGPNKSQWRAEITFLTAADVINHFHCFVPHETVCCMYVIHHSNCFFVFFFFSTLSSLSCGRLVLPDSVAVHFGTTLPFTVSVQKRLSYRQLWPQNRTVIVIIMQDDGLCARYDCCLMMTAMNETTGALHHDFPVAGRVGHGIRGSRGRAHCTHQR